MSLKSPRILVADSDAAQRSKVRCALEHAGFQIEEAANQEQVLDLAQREPEVILLGFGPGELDGYEICRQLKSSSSTSDIPVILMPVHSICEAESERWLATGVDDWIEQSSCSAELPGRLRAWVRVRQAELALGQDRERLSIASDTIDNLSEGLYVVDADGKRLLANSAYFELHGFARGEAPKFISDDSPLVERCDLDGNILPLEQWPVSRALKGETVNQFQLRVRRKDTGREVIASVSASPVRNRKGKVIMAVVTLSDITDRKRAEQEVVAAKDVAESTLAQFRTTIDSMSEGLYIMDAQGKRLLTNSAYFRIHGFQPNCSPEIVASMSSLLERYDVNGNLLAQDRWPVSRALRGETVVQFQQRARRKDTGHEVVVSVNAAPVRDATGKVIMAVVTVDDITAAKQTEQALIRSEKLASVGRMAATVAHEINNPLEAVMNALFIAESQKDLPDSVRHYLELAEGELKRVAHITRQALGFYRESTVPAPTSVNAVLESAIDLLKSKIKAKHARIEKDCEADVHVNAVSGELRQVFSNLLANSLDAIEDNGKIRLRISATNGFRDQGRRVRVTVADDGKGITADALPQIFEPLFTTKGAIGTGLGLWVSKQIVHKHGGFIQVRSNTHGAYRGTMISVYLPAMDQPALRTTAAGGN